jgi:hypothetical protein
MARSIRARPADSDAGRARRIQSDFKFFGKPFGDRGAYLKAARGIAPRACAKAIGNALKKQAYFVPFKNLAPGGDYPA